MDFESIKKQPYVAEIAYRTYAINEYGLDAMFLLVGSEKALLIDTGTGVFHLPEFLKTLTDKPVQVALTHGHPDHAGGMGWFEEVYAHPDDFDMALHLSYETRYGYAKGMLQANPSAPVTAEDTVRFESMPQMRPLKEGDVIDLGDRKVMVFETPGHTPGGLSFLDVKERILFTGDACNVHTLLVTSLAIPNPKATIGVLLRTAEKICSLKPLYDRDYNGHIGYGGIPSVLPQSSHTAEDMASLCRDLLSGAAKGVEQPFVMSGEDRGTCLWAERGAAGVVYKPDALRE